MPTHGKEVDLPLRHAIVTCKLLYHSSWAEIEQKTGVEAHTAAKITHRAIERAGNEDFHDVLACVGNAKGRGSIARIPDGSELSSNVRNAFLKHPHISPTKAVFDKENISIPEARKRRKCMPLTDTQRPPRALLERVQHQHTHVANGVVIGEIVRKREAKKPRLNKTHEQQRKEFNDWILAKLNEGAIFVCSDEKYHEIGGASRPKNVTVSKGTPAEVVPVPKAKAQFTIMQLGAFSTEEEVVMGPIHLWKARTDKERREFDAERAVNNVKSKEEAEKHRERALQAGTEEFEYLEVCFRSRFFY